MKRMFRVTGLIAVVATLMMPLFFAGCTKELSDMANNRDVRVSVTGSNDFTTVTLKVVNTGSSRVKFIIPRGIVLRSDNQSAQPMVVAVRLEVSLAGYESRDIIVPAFCMDFHKHTPLSSDSFGITGYSLASNPDVLKLLEYVGTSGINLNDAQERKIVQYAVWLLVNNLDSRATISDYIDQVMAERHGITTTDKAARHLTVIASVGQGRYNEAVQRIWGSQQMADTRNKVNRLLNGAGIARTY